MIARGGGSLEDLLPFSDETLVRAVAACRTPVVSAIGHEQDTPLLDYVADVRASTPTDAAKRVVPDVSEQLALISQLRDRARRYLTGWLDRETGWLQASGPGPALADPVREIERQGERVDALLQRARMSLSASLARGWRRSGAHPGPAARPVARVHAAPRLRDRAARRRRRGPRRRPRSTRARR